MVLKPAESERRRYRQGGTEWGRQKTRHLATNCVPSPCDQNCKLGHGSGTDPSSTPSSGLTRRGMNHCQSPCLLPRVRFPSRTRFTRVAPHTHEVAEDDASRRTPNKWTHDRRDHRGRSHPFTVRPTLPLFTRELTRIVGGPDPSLHSSPGLDRGPVRRPRDTSGNRPGPMWCGRCWRGLKKGIGEWW